MLEQRSINRACEQCKRKKIRCDGAKPRCALCIRSSQDCYYPRRKAREEKRRHMTAPIPPSQEMSEAPSASFSAPLQLQQHSPDSLISESSQAVELDTQLHSGGSNMPLGLSNPLSAGWNALDVGAHDGSLQNMYSSHDTFQLLTEALPDIWHNDVYVNQPILSPSIESPTDTTSSLQQLAETCRGGGIRERGAFRSTPNSVGGGQTFDTLLCGVDKRFSLSIPAEVVDDLLYLFFLRVQPFLPLFHRPRFYQTYVKLPRNEKYVNLSKQSAFLLYAMMALSARYSTSSYFTDVQEKDRGALFMRKLVKLSDDLISFVSTEVPSLPLLQACILIAYYHRSCNPPNDAKKLVEVCLRIAEQLDLHTIDKSPSDQARGENNAIIEHQLIATEEKRRAWWSLWELDALESILNRCDSGISLDQVHVRLPMPDEAWFTEKPEIAPMFNFELCSCWTVLKGPIQHERVWCLVSNYILAQAFAITRQSVVYKRAVDELEMVIACFSLLFYEKLRSSINSLKFDKDNFAGSNWVILAQLMMQSTRMIVSLLHRRSALNIGAARSELYENGMVKRGWEEHIFTDASIHNFQQPVDEVLRLCRAWPHEGIVFAPPTFVFCVLGPEMMNFQITRSRRLNSEPAKRTQRSLEEELLMLVITHFARYWNIGGVILNMLA